MSYWKTGQLIQRGKYVIEKVLGVGGAGITYQAKDVNTNEIVAIKTLNTALQVQSDFAKHQERFVQEAFRLAKCNHTHVIQVNDVCQEENLWCMVMEYIDGGNLEKLVKNQGDFAEVEAIRYIYQVGSALNYIHQQGILHRDVKPANIMRRSQTSEAVLIDFGLARDFVEDKTQMHTNSRTEGFAPIEQYSRKAKRGAYTDVYALAATLYYLLTRQVPFPAQFRQQGIGLIPPRQHNQNISHRTNLVILKGMELEPQNRPQSVAQWLNLLTENEEIHLYSSNSLSNKKTESNLSSDKQITKKTQDSFEQLTTQTTDEEVVSAIPSNNDNDQSSPPPELKEVKVKQTPTITEYDPFSPTRFENHNLEKTNLEPLSPKSNDILTQIDYSSSAQIQATPLKTNKKSTKKKTDKASFSEVGIDYRPLAQLLHKRKWQEADQKTQNLMLKASGQEDSAWIDRKTMAKFPSKDLQTIDKLWVKYSRGKFGFSVQKRIYLSLGGKRIYDKKAWEALGKKLEWCVDGVWLFTEDLNYTDQSPSGHLPSIAISGILDRGIYTLISRMMDCNIS